MSQQIDLKWELGAQVPVPEARIDQLVSEAARKNPQAIALSHRGSSLTYEDLEARANALAAVLAARFALK